MVVVDAETYEKHKGHRILTGAALGGEIFCDTCGTYLATAKPSTSLAATKEKPDA